MSTKIHATLPALGNPTRFPLTSGKAHDLQGADALMPPLVKAKSVLADKAYDADERFRQKLVDKGCTPVIPFKKNRINSKSYDKYLYKSPHLIENLFAKFVAKFFAKLKQYRAIATRYDKTAQNFLGAIYLVSSLSLLNGSHVLK